MYFMEVDLLPARTMRETTTRASKSLTSLPMDARQQSDRHYVCSADNTITHLSLFLSFVDDSKAYYKQ